MNDEELIERLRGTFRDRADGLRPAPGQLPSTGPGTEPAHPAGHPAPAGPGSVRPTGRGPWRGARRWPPAVGIGVVVAAAAASVALLVSGRTHPVTVRPVGHGSGPVPVSAPAPAGTATGGSPAPAASTAPPLTAPATPPVHAVVPGFRPQSVTFVSADDGWAVGWAPGACATMARTADGGRTWSESGAPKVAGACGTAADAMSYSFDVRFADLRNGWVYATVGPDSLLGDLWSTHDGGATWNEQVPLQGGTIDALEASDGRAQMVVFGPCSPTSAGCQGQTVERILTSPVGADRWQASPLSPPVGAGPVLAPALTLWGPAGWLINDNRTVVSGASLSGAGDWNPWVPPCTGAEGIGILAASSARDLSAVCAEGLWGTPDKGTTAGHNWLFRSTDGGKSFSPVGRAPGDQPISLTTPPGTTATAVLADGVDGLQATFDGGATWTTLEPGEGTGGASAGGYEFHYVGFTTPTQGVAVARMPAPEVFMTRDGGHTWHPVDFAASP